MRVCLFWGEGGIPKLRMFEAASNHLPTWHPLGSRDELALVPGPAALAKAGNAKLHVVLGGGTWQHQGPGAQTHVQGGARGGCVRVNVHACMHVRDFQVESSR